MKGLRFLRAIFGGAIETERLLIEFQRALPLSRPFVKVRDTIKRRRLGARVGDGLAERERTAKVTKRFVFVPQRIKNNAHISQRISFRSLIAERMEGREFLAIVGEGFIAVSKRM